MRLDRILVVLVKKIFQPNAGQVLAFQKSWRSYVPADFGKVLLALILIGNSKSRVFEKIYT